MNTGAAGAGARLADTRGQVGERWRKLAAAAVVRKGEEREPDGARPERGRRAVGRVEAARAKGRPADDDVAVARGVAALQAASLTTLVTLRPLLGVWDPLIPDLILRPRKPLDFGELQQPVRRDMTRFFGTRSQVPTDWAAQAIKLERPRLNRTSMDRRRRWKCSVAGRPRNFTPCGGC